MLRSSVSCMTLAIVVAATFACGPARRTPIPDEVRYDALPVMPVDVRSAWSVRAMAAVRGAPPPVPMGEAFEGTLTQIRLAGTPPASRVMLWIEPDYEPDAGVELGLPLSDDTWLALQSGDRVSVRLVAPPSHIPVIGPSVGLSVTRLLDGVGLHVLGTHSTLPSPYPAQLRLSRKQGRVGYFAESGRDMCRRTGERFALSIKAGAAQRRTVLPGASIQAILEQGRTAVVEWRDCVLFRASRCGIPPEDSWSCQAVVAVVPSELFAP